jgi:uncharacterized protein
MMHMTMHARMQNETTLIIAAIACRPYVKLAAEAGYQVIAIDAFADIDTQRLAKQCFQIPYDGYSLDYQAILNILDDIDLVNVKAFCFGAGFEAEPSVLDEIKQRVNVLGNTSEAIIQCKVPQYFFNMCRRFNMSSPRYSDVRPKQTQGWLKKRIGGSGGHHVSMASDCSFDDKRFYYQKMQKGLPVSCLFLATHESVQLIGINEQWVAADSASPYRYGGAVSHATPTGMNKDSLLNFLQAITDSFELVGLNSCDFILDHDALYVLEINPRLSASVDLYEVVDGNLFSAHINACMQKEVGPLVVSENAKAHQIIYAKKDFEVNESQVWPDWVCDIPQPNAKISAGMPICTVTAKAENAEYAKKLVKERAVFI